jgi:general stress protein 26
MSKEADLAAKFWKALKSDRTVMLGLPGVEDGRAQPMTALIEGDDGGPIWIFTSSETTWSPRWPAREGLLHFASKGHDLFAGRRRFGGRHRRATIDRLWNPFVAAWFEGKDDPKIRLLRFDARPRPDLAERAQPVRGREDDARGDPKKDYKDKVAETKLRLPSGGVGPEAAPARICR